MQFSEKIALKSVQFKGWENIIISGIYLFLMDSANYNYGWGNNHQKNRGAKTVSEGHVRPIVLLFENLCIFLWCKQEGKPHKYG